MSARKKDPSGTAVATNRRARHDFDIEQTYEAGIMLVGSEVKSLRAGKASLADAYALIRKDEAWLYSLHIPEYAQASLQNHDPTRPRKLLLHREEIAKMRVKLEQQGYTLVPLKLYFKDNRVKVELAIARGRKKWDKREAIAARDAKRAMEKHAGAIRKGRA